MQHALKMYKHIEMLDQLGYWMDFELSGLDSSKVTR